MRLPSSPSDFALRSPLWRCKQRENSRSLWMKLFLVWGQAEDHGKFLFISSGSREKPLIDFFLRRILSTRSCSARKICSPERPQGCFGHRPSWWRQQRVVSKTSAWDRFSEHPSAARCRRKSMLLRGSQDLISSLLPQAWPREVRATSVELLPGASPRPEYP